MNLCQPIEWQKKFINNFPKHTSFSDRAGKKTHMHTVFMGVKLILKKNTIICFCHTTFLQTIMYSVLRKVSDSWQIKKSFHWSTWLFLSNCTDLDTYSNTYLMGWMQRNPYLLLYTITLKTCSPLAFLAYLNCRKLVHQKYDAVWLSQC